MMEQMAFKQADISQKPVVFRSATAVGKIRLGSQTMTRVREGRIEKGDPLTLARLTSVTGAKQASNLLALCHPLGIESTETETRLLSDGIEVSVTVSAHEKTGVEMEALTGVSVALLNIWDVVKPYEKDGKGQYPNTQIEAIRIVKKVKSPLESS